MHVFFFPSDQFDVLEKIFQMESLDGQPRTAANKTVQTYPWQSDLQLNLETWRQISSDVQQQRLIIQKKPLKLNVEYLQTYVDKAKNCLKKRSQHELLLNRDSTS